MALRLFLSHPKLVAQQPKPMNIKSQTHPLLLPITTRSSKFQICCSNTNNSKINDLELALDLATKVEKLKTQLEHKQEVMKKSRHMLFTELCQYLDLGTEEFKSKWENMDEDGKLVLIKGFVAEWAANFHPLSARAVKQMVDDYLVDLKYSSPSLLFTGLKKLLGFQNKE